MAARYPNIRFFSNMFKMNDLVSAVAQCQLGRRLSSTITTSNRLLCEIHKQEQARMDNLRGFSLPSFGPGDLVRFEMPQTMSPDESRKNDVIEGVVIARRNQGFDSTFVVRSIVEGLGCEHTIPVYSPWIRNFQILKHQRARRAKLYYLRKTPNTIDI